MDNISISGEEVTAITITSGGNGWIYGDGALNAPERIVPVSDWSAMWKFWKTAAQKTRQRGNPNAQQGQGHS